MKKMKIAIDGPAAAGKSTVAKMVADRCSYIYIDTGAMYRALTYQALRKGINVEEEDALSDLLNSITIDLVPTQSGQHVLINNEDVTDAIRESDVTNLVSVVAKHEKVRGELVARQRELAQGSGVVMDGRDIGTHVLPDAEVKVFLLASVEERAKRRHSENIRRGFPSDMELLKKEISERDKLDMEREVSPLMKAEDAIEIDSTALSIDQVVEEILKLIRERAEVR